MFKTAKVVGLNSDKHSAQVLISQSQPSVGDSDQVSPADLSLLTIVYCSCDDAFSRTRQALLEAESVFYASSQIGSQRIREVEEVLKQQLSDTEEFEYLIGLISSKEQTDQVLYLICQGDSLAAYLIRDSVQTDLCQMGEGGRLVSGFLKPGDRVILTTKSLVEVLGDESKEMRRWPVETWEEEVTLRFPQGQVSPVAAIVVEEEQPEIPVSEIPEVRDSRSRASIKEKVRPILRAAAAGLVAVCRRAIPRSRKALLFVLVVVVLLGLAGLGLFLKHQNDAKLFAGFNTQLSQASDYYNKALGAKDSDPGSAADNLKQANTFLAEALKIKPQDAQALELKKQIADNTPAILKTVTVGDFPLWLDLGLVKKDFKASLLSYSLGNLLILDQTQEVLIKIGLANKSNQILAGQDKLGKAKLVSLNGQAAFVFSDDKGVLKVDITNNQVTQAVKTDSDWGSMIDLYGFAGNIYLLDSGKDQIWKYLPVASGYSDKREYFISGTKVDLTGAKRLQIDRSIWILKGNGEILKFTQGAPDNFSLGGLDKPIGDLKSFFVPEEGDNVYLLDNANNRLVVVGKSGAYQSQYISDRFNDFTDFVVDEASKKAYFLSGSKIFQIILQ